MLELNSENFYAEANSKNTFLCLFYNKSVANIQQIIPSLFVADYEPNELKIGCLNLENARDIAHMFGVDSLDPTILIMREKIVLFCEPVLSLENTDIYAVAKRISRLDIDKIKTEIRVEKESMMHLFGRGVCPTAKRSRENDT
jgi:hypothetical protein